MVDEFHKCMDCGKPIMGAASYRAFDNREDFCFCCPQIYDPVNEQELSNLRAQKKQLEQDLEEMRAAACEAQGQLFDLQNHVHGDQFKGGKTYAESIQAVNELKAQLDEAHKRAAYFRDNASRYRQRLNELGDHECVELSVTAQLHSRYDLAAETWLKEYEIQILLGAVLRSIWAGCCWCEDCQRVAYDIVGDYADEAFNRPGNPSAHKPHEWLKAHDREILQKAAERAAPDGCQCHDCNEVRGLILGEE